MGLVIKLFGEPEVTLDDEVVELSVALPTLALLILWRDRSEVEADQLVDVLKPGSEAGDRTSFLKKHKTRLRERLGLDLPRSLKPSSSGPAIVEQAWVDVVCFDEKIGSADRREVQEALELRRRGPLLAGLKGADLFAGERKTREEKYQDALWKRIEETSEGQPEEAVGLIHRLLECDGLPESRAAFLREQRLKLEHELFKNKSESGDGKTTRTLHLPTLPSFPTELLGRDEEVAAVQALFFASRLVTLLGPAGIGKTRLAVAVAGRLQENFSAGAAFADLTTASDAEQIVRQISAPLGLREETDRPRRETLLAYLADKNLLLVWDNCEPVAAACAELAAEALRRSPALRILATSRESLRVYGERLHPVPVLPEDSAERLFLARAQSVQSQFQITEQNQAAVSKICRDLDGLPLALELAAALLDVRTVKWIAGNLDKRFEMLVDGPRTGSPRHASLQVAFDLSYDLLPPAEQALFRALGVFAGTFSLDAVEAVAPVSDTAASGTAFLLTQLVRKSLVLAVEQGDEMRFRLLVTVRQYAQDRLRELGEWDEMRRRHRGCFLALAEEADPKLKGPDQKQWLRRLEAEQENLTSALASFRESGDQGDQWLRLAGHLWWFWWVHGDLKEGRDYLAEALAQAKDASLKARARALEGLGNLAEHQGDYEAAQSALEQSLALLRGLHDARHAASVLGSLGNLAYNMADFAQAEARHQEGFDIFRELNDERGILVSHINLGNLAYELKDHGRAGTHFRSALALAQRQQDERHIALSLYSLGNVARETADFPEAGRLLRESLTRFSTWGDPWSIVHLLEALAFLAAAQTQVSRAARLWGASESLRERLNAPLTPSGRLAYEQAVAKASAALGAEAFEAALAEGQAMTWEQAVDFALRT